LAAPETISLFIDWLVPTEI